MTADELVARWLCHAAIFGRASDVTPGPDRYTCTHPLGAGIEIDVPAGQIVATVDTRQTEGKSYGHVGIYKFEVISDRWISLLPQGIELLPRR